MPYGADSIPLLGKGVDEDENGAWQRAVRDFRNNDETALA